MATPLMNLPEITENQSAKYLTHNDALNKLEGFIRILDRDLLSPPAAVNGDTYYIAAAGPATGAWTGFEGYLAHYVNSAWTFALPFDGLRMWISDEDANVLWDASAVPADKWVLIGGLGTVDSATNLGGFTEVFKGPNLSVLEFRTVQSSDTSLTITQNTNDVDIVLKQGQTAQVYFAEATLTDAATISWDVDIAQTATVTLAGNRTLQNPTNLQAGATYILRVVQDGAGSRTLSYDTVYKWPGGTAPTLSTGSGAIDILTFYTDGTNMYGVSNLDFS